VDGFSDDFETGADGWTLGGWTHTTGLFDNDWVGATFNPIYDRGRFDHLDWGYLTPTCDTEVCEMTETLDTSHLVKDEAIVAFANRPGDSPFSADYLILVSRAKA
jgi:hypothetical protein